MSVVNNIATLPDTRRNFSPEMNDYAYFTGLYVHNKDVSFASVAAFQDIDEYLSLLESGDLIPLHNIKSTEYLDEETQYKESLQNYPYKARPGKYRRKHNFIWQIDRHQLVEQMSGSDKYVIYIDRNRNIYGTSDDGVTVRGFSTDAIVLEKLIMATESDPAFSPLFIALKDSDELNVRGVIKQVDWQPTDVNRLFMSIAIEFLDADTLNFSATYNGAAVESIGSSDVTVSDDTNGIMNFSLFNYLGGVYQLSGFTAVDPTKIDSLTGGKLEILSSLYLGCVLYRVTIEVVIPANNFVFEDGENFVFEDGENFIFEN